MTGKIVAAVIVACGLIAGIAIYYLQIYGYYYEVTPRPGQDVTLVPEGAGSAQPILYADFRAIDADSSPIRYRACFTTPLTAEDLAGFTASERAEPRVAPGWFDCFDAEAIGAGIAAGEIRSFLSIKNVAYGVDRIVAIAPDGRGWAWHEFNDCGSKAYDGTVVGEECPPNPAASGG